MIRYILLVFNILIFTSFFSILIILVGLFDKAKDKTAYLAHLWARSILKFSNITYSIEGLDKISNNKQYVIISNHQSAIDILVTFASIPNPIAFFTKKELFLIALINLVTLPNSPGPKTTPDLQIVRILESEFCSFQFI